MILACIGPIFRDGTVSTNAHMDPTVCHTPVVLHQHLTGKYKESTVNSMTTVSDVWLTLTCSATYQTTEMWVTAQIRPFKTMNGAYFGNYGQPKNS